MKKILLGVLILFSQIGYSQKIGEKTFDKFDSTYEISTKDETLVGRALGYDYLYVQAYFLWQKKAKYINYPKAKSFSIIVGFKSHGVTSLDNKSVMKVEFEDETFGTYNNPNADYQIVSENGVVMFKVPLDDKLFTTGIKAIRIVTSDMNLDYEIPTKKRSYIKNALALVKTESEKPF